MLVLAMKQDTTTRASQLREMLRAPLLRFPGGIEQSVDDDHDLSLVRSATLERPKSAIFGFRLRSEGAEFPLAAGDDLSKHSAVRGVPLGPGEAELRRHDLSPRRRRRLITGQGWWALLWAG